jgi:hypothetical protein
MPCCKHIIANYVPHIPWIEDLLGSFLSFSFLYYVTKSNPSPQCLSFPDCPVLLGLTLPPTL